MISKEQYIVLNDIEKTETFPVLMDYDELNLRWSDIEEYIQEIVDEKKTRTVLNNKGKKAIQEYRRAKFGDIKSLISLILSGIAIVISIIVAIVK